MEQRYLIDTSATIKYLNGSFPHKGLQFMDMIVDQESRISFISKIELLVWNPQVKEDLEIYKQFVSQSVVLGI